MKKYTFTEKVMPIDGQYSEAFLNICSATGETKQEAKANLEKSNESIGYGTIWATLIFEEEV